MMRRKAFFTSGCSSLKRAPKEKGNMFLFDKRHMSHARQRLYISGHAAGSVPVLLSRDVQAQGDNVQKANSEVWAPCQRFRIVQNREIWNYDEVCFSTTMSPSDGGVRSTLFLRGVAEESNLGEG